MVNAPSKTNRSKQQTNITGNWGHPSTSCRPITNTYVLEEPELTSWQSEQELTNQASNQSDLAKKLYKWWNRIRTTEIEVNCGSIWTTCQLHANGPRKPRKQDITIIKKYAPATTETNLLIYTTATTMHIKLHQGKNTKRIEQNTPPWQIGKEK